MNRLRNTRDRLIALAESRHPGWDRTAEALIAQAFYGNAATMVMAYIDRLEALIKETDDGQG